MKWIGLAGLAATATLAAPAVADEVWVTERGEAYYAEEIGGFAIFQVPWGEDVEATFYFEGLAGNYDHRGTHEGYWIFPSQIEECPAVLVGVDHLASPEWGRVTLVFDEASFPTGWTATVTTCFNDDPFAIRADLPN